MTLVCVENHVLSPTVCPWVKHLQKRIASMCWMDAENLSLGTCQFFWSKTIRGSDVINEVLVKGTTSQWNDFSSKQVEKVWNSLGFLCYKWVLTIGALLIAGKNQAHVRCKITGVFWDILSGRNFGIFSVFCITYSVY